MVKYKKDKKQRSTKHYTEN